MEPLRPKARKSARRLTASKRALPLAFAGERIGLYGGSFDPPHAGHAHVARTALKAGRLDRIWWLPTPGNPFKSQAPSASTARRIEAICALLRKEGVRGRMAVSAFEALRGYRYSVDTVSALQDLFPSVEFVFVMGADAFAGLPGWRKSEALMRRISFLVVSRPDVPGRAWRWSAAMLRRKAPLDLSGGGGFAFVPARYHPLASRVLRAAMLEA